MFPFPPAPPSTSVPGNYGEPPRRPDLAGIGVHDASLGAQTGHDVLIGILTDADMGEAAAQYFRSEQRVNAFVRALSDARIPPSDHAGVVNLFTQRCLGREPTGETPMPDQARARHARAITENEAPVVRRTRKAKTPRAADAPTVRARNISIRQGTSRKPGKTSPSAPSPSIALDEPSRPNDFLEYGLTALMGAVRDGDADKFAELLENGGDPTLTVTRPKVLTIEDCETLQTSATLFLDSDADDSRKRIDPAPVFVENLLKIFPFMHGEMDFSRKHAGRNALTMAIASFAPRELVKSICLWSAGRQKGEKGWAFLNQKDDLGETPLCLAAEIGSRTHARLLIEHGADLEQRNARLMTPLMSAAGRNDFAMVKLLLRRGAHPMPVLADVKASPLSLARLNKRLDNALAHGEVLKRLLKAIPAHCPEICKTINSDRERSNKSDSSRVLRRTVVAIAKIEKTAKDSGDEAMSALAQHALTLIFEAARDNFNSVDLMDYCLFAPMQIVDSYLRTEALHNAFCQMPTDWARLFTVARPAVKPGDKPPVPWRSMHSSQFEHTIQALRIHAREADKDGRGLSRRLAVECEHGSLLAVCKTGNIFDLAVFIKLVDGLREPERRSGVYEVLLKRAPVEWERLLQTVHEAFGENGAEEGYYDILATTVNQLSALRSSGAPHMTKSAETCLYNMWASACKYMTPSELANFVGDVGRDSPARLYLINHVIGVLLKDMLDKIKAVSKLHGNEALAANLFIDTYKMADIVLSAQTDGMRNCPPLLSQRTLVAHCFGALTSQGKNAALDRLTRAEMMDLRELVARHEKGLARAANLSRIDKRLAA